MRMTTRRLAAIHALRCGVTGATLVSLLLTLDPAFAATDDSIDSSGALEEIVVTANKREQNLRDVPVSVGVIDGNVIDSLRVDSVEDVTRIVPGVSFAAHQNGPNGPGQDNITIRGVSSTVGNPTVGLYIDEVPIITTTGYEGDAEPRLIDIDRVEVLRGPQGTLYGASSEGGTVRFITNQPDSHAFSGSIRQDLSYTHSGGFNYDDRGALNIPVVEGSFALRISAEYGEDSGYINQYALVGSLAAGTGGAGALLKRGTNSDSNAALDVKGLWTIGQHFTVTPAFLYQRQTAGDTSTFIPALGYYNQNDQVLATDNDVLYIPSLTVKAGLPGIADLTSVSSYVNRQVQRYTDGTLFNTAAIVAYSLDTAGTPPYTTHQMQDDDILGNIASPVVFTDHFNTVTQEFRIASPAEQKQIKWVAGFFFSNQEWTHLDHETSPGFSAEFQNIYGYSIDTDPVLNPTLSSPPLNTNFWANDLVWQVYDHNQVTQYAGFGQLDIDLLPTLHLGLGDRYVYATEKFSELGAGFFDFGNAGTTGTPYAQSTHFDTSTPKFTLTYDLNQHSTLYTSVGKGFRLGGATTPNDNTLCLEGFVQLGDTNPPKTYGPDQLWSYEFGSKSLVFDNTLSVNADVYLIRWDSIQQSVTIPICGGAFNTNVGDATAIGGELEVRYKPPVVAGLALGLNLGAEHAYITGTLNASTAAVGQDVLYTPNYTATVLADYGWHVTDSVAAFVRGDYEYTGSSYGSFQIGTSAYVDPSYSVVNLNAGVRVSRFEASLFAKNLLDNKTILQSPQINSVQEGYTLRPQTIGLALQAKF
jgi:outer membrane receptor protein involved in Fe transport